jgi:disulfide bond formation protein DsbB
MKINFVSAAFSIAAAAVLTLAGAWFFQLVVGLSPCPLCLDQRVPYYVAVPLALGVASLAQNETLARIGFYVLAFVLAIAFALAVYHAGVEWKFWEGPADCSAAVVNLGSGSLIEQMNQSRVVRCDEAPWRLFGISLAGYNALIAGTLTLFAVWVARRKV